MGSVKLPLIIRFCNSLSCFLCTNEDVLLLVLVQLRERLKSPETMILRFFALAAASHSCSTLRSSVALGSESEGLPWNPMILNVFDLVSRSNLESRSDGWKCTLVHLCIQVLRIAIIMPLPSLAGVGSEE